jgi:hypothetical protein
MSPYMESRRYIDGVEIKPGAMITHRAQMDLRFTIKAVCEGTDPDVWVGHVMLAGNVLMRTQPQSDYGVAGRAAENLLIDRMADPLGDQ